MKDEPRPIVWEAQHKNGWRTIIVQQHDAFVGYTLDGRAVQLAYLRETFEEACAAVVASLARATGHNECSSECSEWVMRVSRPGELEPERSLGSLGSRLHPSRDDPAASQ